MISTQIYLAKIRKGTGDFFSLLFFLCLLFSFGCMTQFNLPNGDPGEDSLWDTDETEHQFDDCSIDPCANGECIEDGDSYSCDCDAGWTGVHCNQNVDDCTPNPCVHGTCTDGIKSYSCSCETGWTGTKCDQEVDNCDLDPCVNGKCIDVDGSYSCDCESGWTGPNCDRSIDDCTPNPCVHGTCTDGIKSYSCSCDTGWFGKNCDLEDGGCPTGISFSSKAQFTDLIESSSPQVYEFHDACGDGQVVVGYHGFLRDVSGKNLVHGKIQALCATPSIISENGECLVKMGSTTKTPLRGDMGTLEWTRKCPDDEVIVGYEGTTGMDIDRIFFVCAPLIIDAQTDVFTISRGDFTYLDQAGGKGGNYVYKDECPDGQVATSSVIHTSNILVNALGMGCQSPTLDY